MKKIFLLTLAIPLLFSCGKEEKQNENTDVIEYNETSNTEDTNNTSTAVATTNHIVLKADDNMTFDKTDFTVKVGEEITLLLLNNGSASKEAMGHNVVVLKQGTDIGDFSFAASSEKESDYIPKDKLDAIIAHTKLLGGKENDQIKFTLDKEGSYDFICSFPGHTATMKGKITAVK